MLIISIHFHGRKKEGEKEKSKKTQHLPFLLLLYPFSRTTQNIKVLHVIF